MQCDGVERPVEPGGLDVQRDPAQRASVVVAPDRGVAHLQMAGSAHHLAVRRETGRHETLHQVAIGRLQIGLAGRAATAAKQVPRRHQITLATEVESVDRRALQGREGEFAPLALQTRRRIVPRQRRPLHEAHRLFPVEHDP